MIYYLLLDRKERYPSCEDQDLPPGMMLREGQAGSPDPRIPEGGTEGLQALSF